MSGIQTLRPKTFNFRTTGFEDRGWCEHGLLNAFSNMFWLERGFAASRRDSPEL
jgi:hypothetical protein